MKKSQSTNISQKSGQSGSKTSGDRRIAALRDRDTRKRNIAVIGGIVAILVIWPSPPTVITRILLNRQEYLLLKWAMSSIRTVI